MVDWEAVREVVNVVVGWEGVREGVKMVVIKVVVDWVQEGEGGMVLQKVEGGHLEVLKVVIKVVGVVVVAVRMEEVILVKAGVEKVGGNKVRAKKVGAGV